jgi:multiple sugar transport system permease protein
MFSVLFVNAWNYYPLYMMLLLGGLQAIPQTLYEAAKVDGANRVQSFWHITLPQMNTLIMTIVIIDFITTFIHFDLVWTMTKGGPLRSTYLISFFLYEKGLLTYKFGYASALSVVIALIIFTFLFGYIALYSRKGEV